VRVVLNLGPEQAVAAKSEIVRLLRQGGLHRLPDRVFAGAVAGETEEGRLTIGEIVRIQQSEVWAVLARRYLCFAVDWEAIMTERPLSGRSGILPEERGS